VGTSVSLSCTCRTPDGTGSGRTGFVAHALRGLDARGMAARAADIALRSQNPQAIEPGRHTVVLAPEAVAELLEFMVESMGARRAAEGRSWFSGKDGATRIGERLFDERITMWSDPADRNDPASPIAEDGRPQAKVTWIDKGVLKALTTTRFWAQKSGLPSLPRPSSIHLAGGQGDLDALVAGVERGVLVTRFWYNRMVEPRTILATGLTRDGTFLIENGKPTKPVKNMRYNESPVTLLKNVVELGAPRRAAVYDETVWVVPPLLVEGFNFESVSDAV
jgi:predicted Zn-dependent protease